MVYNFKWYFGLKMIENDELVKTNEGKKNVNDCNSFKKKFIKYDMILLKKL